MSVLMSALSSFKLGDCVNCYGVHCQSHANESSGLSIDVWRSMRQNLAFILPPKIPLFSYMKFFRTFFPPLTNVNL